MVLADIQLDAVTVAQLGLLEVEKLAVACPGTSPVRP